MRDDDLPDRLGELIRHGAIEAVDLSAATVTVRLGDLVTQPLPFLTGGAGGTRIWSRPKVGEQVVLLAPEGDVAGAVALRGFHTGAFPPLADPDREIVQFEDGTILAYDPASHDLDVVLSGAGTVTIDTPGRIALTAPGGVTIDADVRVTRDLVVDGKVTAAEDVLGAGKSLKGHKHLGVVAGNAVSGVPQ